MTADAPDAVKLLPCPFCGSNNSHVYEPPYGGFAAICEGCGAEGAQGDSNDEACQKWNERSDSTIAQLQRWLAEAQAQTRAVYSASIKMAAKLATNQGMDRLFPDNHPKPASRAYWLALLEHAGDIARDRAVELRAAIDMALKESP